MPKVPAARLALWAYAAAGISLGARSLVVAPPPLWASSLALAGYALLGTLGVFWPERGMFGRVLWHGPAKPEVALTFDDGPSPATTPLVLERLAAAGARATFFLVGHKVEAHPSVVKDIVAAGHEVALHGFDHDRLFSLRLRDHVVRDIARTQDALERAGAPRSLLFRPPVGFVSHFTVSGARQAGVRLVGCSARALDGLRSATSDKVAKRLVRAIRPGALLALHDAAEHDDYTPASIAALPHVLEVIRQRQLRTVTLSEWSAPPPDLAP